MFYLRVAGLMAKDFFGLSQKNSSIIQSRVWINEADVHVVNNATYLQYLELGRVDLMLKTGFFWPSIKEKLFVPMRTLHIDFRRPLRRFQKFEVATRILAWDHKNIFVVQGIQSNSKSSVLAFMNSVVKSGRETVPPETIVPRLKVEPKLDPEALAFCQSFSGSQDDFNKIEDSLFKN